MENNNSGLFAAGPVTPTEEELKILKKYKKRNQFVEVARRLRKNKAAVLGFIILITIFTLAFIANILYDYNSAVVAANYSETLQAPSLAHPFGTDEMGRDLLARVIYGSRISLTIAVVTTCISFTVGGILGAYCGYLGGMFDAVVMRFMDIFLAIPNMLLALTIVAAFGSNLMNLMIAIAISDIPRFARILRSAILSIRDSEYVEAAKAVGAKTRTIIFREIIPNCLAPLIVQASIVMAAAIITAASLSFIGLGIQPPTPEWGSMLSGARDYMREYSYMTWFPGLAIVMTVLAFNLLGDGLRDALDPRLKQ
ncbi:MAG: ABC transporter permease [Oscillospiraceae bacterium]